MEGILTNTSENNIKHIQTAHCENGVVTTLLRHHGVDFMNEPLAFGIGAGMFYVHLPFLKVNNAPAIAFRIMPGYIFRDTCKALGVKVSRKKFRSPVTARAYLDKKLEDGDPVGCQVGVFHLPYFPREYRFHFNAHNIIVHGFEDGHYIVSDPVMETLTKLTPEQLDEVRFARGPLAPNGQMYYPINVGEIDEAKLKKAIKKGIKKTTWWMTQVPMEQVGASGFNYTAKKIRKWRDQLGERRAALYLAQIVRMQEEIGTGGGGFRFIYAAFLEQAAEILGKDELIRFSEEMTKSGDLLRYNAVRMASIIKGRATAQQNFDEVADAMSEISALELKTFKELRKLRL
ncbi:BtrH N-terminal domain-containing protein [Fulvivirga maritima]|uniref:BtrH N-terminal domain-containing protein n=1 Tax=Fulvivirga maritima TaxID=2904247 RepID=UPI001F29CADE|nr:BtrH N-terminal domain-containing protein [Fulvivirga maritima]UII27333.1 BtrH N-terminal domain-containing protein [Fulvivirga maritima]